MESVCTGVDRLSPVSNKNEVRLSVEKNWNVVGVRESGVYFCLCVLGLILLFDFAMVMVRNQCFGVKTRLARQSLPQEVCASTIWIVQMYNRDITLHHGINRPHRRLLYGPEPIHKMTVQ